MDQEGQEDQELDVEKGWEAHEPDAEWEQEAQTAEQMGQELVEDQEAVQRAKRMDQDQAEEVPKPEVQDAELTRVLNLREPVTAR